MVSDCTIIFEVEPNFQQMLSQDQKWTLLGETFAQGQNYQKTIKTQLTQQLIPDLNFMVLLLLGLCFGDFLLVLTNKEIIMKNWFPMPGAAEL